MEPVIAIIITTAILISIPLVGTLIKASVLRELEREDEKTINK